MLAMLLLLRAAAIKGLGIFQNWIVSVCIFGLLSVFIITPGRWARPFVD